MSEKTLGQVASEAWSAWRRSAGVSNMFDFLAAAVIAEHERRTNYRELLMKAAKELAALGKDGLIIDEDLAGDLQIFAARIRAALEGKCLK